MSVQLRRYRIAPRRVAQFAEEWRRGVVPLRQRYGFEIQGWVVDATDEFIWVLRHSDRDSFDAADAAYYRSSERAALDPDPARLIEAAHHDWVTPAL
jgi:NIPSNAP